MISKDEMPWLFNKFSYLVIGEIYQSKAAVSHLMDEYVVEKERQWKSNFYHSTVKYLHVNNTTTEHRLIITCSILISLNGVRTADLQRIFYIPNPLVMIADDCISTPTWSKPHGLCQPWGTLPKKGRRIFILILRAQLFKDSRLKVYRHLHKTSSVKLKNNVDTKFKTIKGFLYKPHSSTHKFNDNVVCLVASWTSGIKQEPRGLHWLEFKF